MTRRTENQKSLQHYLQKAWSDSARAASAAARVKDAGKNNHEKARAIGEKVEKDFGMEDGADIAHHMLESKEIKDDHSMGEAAHMVAQRIGQP